MTMRTFKFSSSLLILNSPPLSPGEHYRTSLAPSSYLSKLFHLAMKGKEDFRRLSPRDNVGPSQLGFKTCSGGLLPDRGGRIVGKSRIFFRIPNFKKFYALIWLLTLPCAWYRLLISVNFILTRLYSCVFCSGQSSVHGKGDNELVWILPWEVTIFCNEIYFIF